MKQEPSKMSEKQKIGQERLILNDNIRPQSQMFPMISASTNPFLAGLHILIKLAILAAYLIIPLFTAETSVLQFVIIGAAVDFWIVKNLAGRLLVGLRWWVDFDQKGEEMWKFQCKVNEKQVNPANDKIFWWILALFSLIWLVLTVINVFRLNITHISICGFCAAMLIFNLYSYYRCSKVQSENIKKLAYQYGADVAGKFMHGAIVAQYF